MTKKKGPRFPHLENPTAAYPVGTLGGTAPREAVPGSAPHEADDDRAAQEESELDDDDTFPDEDELVDDEEDQFEESDEYQTASFWPTNTERVHPAFLLLSLIGGGALALAVVALIGLLLLVG